MVARPLAAALRVEVRSEQIIGQTELLAVVAAKIEWQGVITAKGGRMVLLLVDNDAALIGVTQRLQPVQVVGMATHGNRKARHAQWRLHVGRQGPINIQPSRRTSKMQFDRIRHMLNGRVRLVNLQEKSTDHVRVERRRERDGTRRTTF